MRKSPLNIPLLMLLTSVILLSPMGCGKAKVVTVGVVSPNSGLAAVVEGFRSGMSKSGYVEGKDIVYVYKGVISEREIEGELRRLVARRVDLILAVGSLATRKAKESVAGSRIPVVFAPVLFPVNSGFVESIAHPGGNLTGIQVGGGTPKALEWHKAIFPRSKIFFVPCRCADEPAEMSMADLKEAAAKLGIKIIAAEVDSADDLKHALDNIPEGVDSLWLLNSPFLVSHVDIFVKAAMRRKIPLSSGTSQYKSGVLLSFAQDPFRTGEQASRLAAKILDGVPPGNIPVETADFLLGINLRMARAIGVRIDDNILAQANRIVRE